MCFTCGAGLSTRSIADPRRMARVPFSCAAAATSRFLGFGAFRVEEILLMRLLRFGCVCNNLVGRVSRCLDHPTPYNRNPPSKFLLLGNVFHHP